MAQQGSPPRRTSRRPEPDERSVSVPAGHAERARRAPREPGPARPGWRADVFSPGDDDADLPPWAGPSDYPAKPAVRRAPPPYAGGYAGEAGGYERDGYADAGDGLRGARDPAADGPGEGGRLAVRRRGRAAATRLRKSRRRVYRWCGVAISVCVIAALVTILVTHHSPKPLPYVTSLLHGEFKSVPDTCASVSAAVLAQYVPQPGRTTTSQFSEPTQSQCSFSVDHKPLFRLLQVSAQAYQPFAAATGNGSASANAADNLASVQLQLQKPPAKSVLSAASITPLTGLGQQAFAAAQTERAAGITSDVVTVVVLERNVLITATMTAQQAPGFAPVSAATLQAGAVAAARDTLAKLSKEPVA